VRALTFKTLTVNIIVLKLAVADVFDTVYVTKNLLNLTLPGERSL